jgi:teichuronic acid biosynthesis glycosyltransferase TuaC
MRALVVTNMYPTDTHPGSGTFVADQVRSLKAAGADVELLFVDRPQGGRQAYRELAERTRNLVETHKPSLVHVMYGGVMASIVTRAVHDRPVLVSFHGSDLLGTSRNGVIGTLSWRYGILSSRRAAARAAGIIVVSPVLLDALPRRIDKSRVWIVPNGIDLARFRPVERLECQRVLGWDSTRKHVLFPAPPGRPEKRFALARASVEMLSKKGEHVDLHTLENVPHEKVPVWLNAASAVLLTSSHEGSPTAVKEALACNVPVVSVDVGDVRERITGIEGCFITDAVVGDIAAKLDRALGGRERIEARGRVEEFSLEQVAAKLLEIYGVVANRPLRTPT